MVEVCIKKFLYINGIPAELLKQALEAGELKRGKIVGLNVQPESGDEAFIELKLMEHGQEKLIREGQAIPVEQVGGVIVMDPSWKAYLDKAHACQPSEHSFVSRPTVP